jgi:hypothetical protein
VLYECLELARLKIAMDLAISPDWVHAEVRVDDAGKIKATMNVDVGAEKLHSTEKIRASIQANYLDARGRAESRFQNLGERWHGCE